MMCCQTAVVRCLLLGIALVPALADAGPPPLPTEGVLAAAAARLPVWQAEQSRLEAVRHAATLLERGPHEWTVFVSGARRSATGEGQFAEWDGSIERGLRLPGKSGIDHQLAMQQRELADLQSSLGTRHARRLVLERWFECVAGVRARQISARVKLASAQLAADARNRAAHGDVSLLEAEQAAAEADAQAADAAARNAIANAGMLAWESLAPGTTCDNGEATPTSFDLPPLTPAEGDGGMEAIREWAATNHAHAATLARRADAERWGDPVVGLRAGRERGGLERVVGVTLSIPLGPGRRRLAGRQAAAEARAAALDAAAEAQQLELEWATARRTLPLVRDEAAALRAAHASAESALRRGEVALALGGVDLAEILVLRRRSHELALAADAAALSAWRWTLLLQEWERPR